MIHSHEGVFSLTQDLSNCKNSGFAIYEPREKSHFSEEKSFHLSVDDSKVSLLGVFDGFQGNGIAKLASKKMTAELLLGQILTSSSDEHIKSALSHAFQSFHNDLLVYLGEKMDKSQLRYSILEYSATLALIHNEKRLFVANIGTNHAMYSSKDSSSSSLKAVDLTVQAFEGENKEEDFRLQLLGLNNSVRDDSSKYSRCHNPPALKCFSDTPVLSVPNIIGGISLESEYCFLIISSTSLLTCLTQSHNFSGVNINDELCRMIFSEFKENINLSSLAQTIMDSALKIYFERFDSEFSQNASLLITNLNCKLEEEPPIKYTRPHFTISSTTTEGSEFTDKLLHNHLPVDENGQIQPYVDLSPLNEEWNKYVLSHGGVEL